MAGRKYWTAGGELTTLRESQSHLNTAAGRGESRRHGGAGGDTAVDASDQRLERISCSACTSRWR